ncbi:MAG: cobalamin biosynthesis protein [Phyllobacteriaceae bacterium]|nr:cobalamin biosynthesis protein [Phyllobacteriaceae bacterium]
MTAQFLAVGVGCRSGVAAEVIVDLVEAALARTARADLAVALFTVVDKSSEPGIAEAAGRLGLTLVHLPRVALETVADRVATRSQKVIELFGVPSIAEGSALAGAGAAGRLLFPRIADRGATVAVAISGEDGGTP